MSTKSFQYSNKSQREYQKVMSESEWIIKTSDSYREAYGKLKKLKLCGAPLFHSTITSILGSKNTLNLNPKLKKSSKGGKKPVKKIKSKKK